MAPQLRNILRRKLSREILTSLGLGVAAGAIYWYSIVLPRRRRYEDFYRNYDAKAVADSMTASFEEGGHQLDIYVMFAPPTLPHRELRRLRTLCTVTMASHHLRQYICIP